MHEILKNLIKYYITKTLFFQCYKTVQALSPLHNFHLLVSDRNLIYSQAITKAFGSLKF